MRSVRTQRKAIRTVKYTSEGRVTDEKQRVGYSLSEIRGDGRRAC